MNQLTKPSELLRTAWADYKTKAKMLALLMAAFYVLMGVVLMIATGGTLATTYGAEDLGAGAVPFGIGMFIVAIAGILVEIALVYLAAGREQDIKAALKKAKSKFWIFLGLALLTGLTVLGGLILVIIPGLIFAVWFSLGYFVVLLENRKIVDSMKRSKAYVKGRFWPVVARILFLFVVLLPFWIISSIGGDENILGFLIDAAVGIFIGPFAVVYMYHLYKDLKGTAVVPVEPSSTPQAL